MSGMSTTESLLQQQQYKSRSKQLDEAIFPSNVKNWKGVAKRSAEVIEGLLPHLKDETRLWEDENALSGHDLKNKDFKTYILEYLQKKHRSKIAQRRQEIQNSMTPEATDLNIDSLQKFKPKTKFSQIEMSFEPSPSPFEVRVNRRGGAGSQQREALMNLRKSRSKEKIIVGGMQVKAKKKK